MTIVTFLQVWSWKRSYGGSSRNATATSQGCNFPWLRPQSRRDTHIGGFGGLSDGHVVRTTRSCSEALGQLSTSFSRLNHASPPGRSLLPDAVELAGQPTGARYPRTLSLPQSSLHGESRGHRVSLAHCRRMNIARHTRRVVIYREV
jgi:hypothetical protein